MEREIAWIKTALNRDRKKTQTGLAAALNLDKSAVSRLLRGERRLKFSEATLAASYLGIHPPGGFAEEHEAFIHASQFGQNETALAPLFEVTIAATGAWRLDRKSIIERRPRSPMMTAVPSAFGFYVPNNIMAPRFKLGEVAWVNPARPVAPGDDALLISTQSDDSPCDVVLCELSDIEDTQFVVFQHNGADNTRFARTNWNALHIFARR